MHHSSSEIRNNMTEKLLAIGDKKLLKAIDKIVDTTSGNKSYKLSDLQKELIMASEEDIKYGKLTKDEDINREEDEWLNQ